jgi:hypothetical protein
MWIGHTTSSENFVAVPNGGVEAGKLNLQGNLIRWDVFSNDRYKDSKWTCVDGKWVANGHAASDRKIEPRSPLPLTVKESPVPDLASDPPFGTPKVNGGKLNR